MTKEANLEILNAKYERPLDTDGDIDPRVRGLVNGVGITGLKVLEIGTLDGFHACQLASFGGIVTASDIRPDNLKLALYRSLYHGITNMKFRLLDMEEMPLKIQKDEYDIIFHSGCFYHLHDPIKHLIEIAPLAKYILLETHVGDGKRPLLDYALRPNHSPSFNIQEKPSDKTIYRRLQYWEYPETGWADARSSKDNRLSKWLTTESLEYLIEYCNLRIVKTVYKDYPNIHGPRVCYLLKRRD